MAQKLKLSERLMRGRPLPMWERTEDYLFGVHQPPATHVPFLGVRMFNYDAALIKELNQRHGRSPLNKVFPELIRLQMEDDVVVWRSRFSSYCLQSLVRSFGQFERIGLITRVICEGDVDSLLGVQALETEGILALAKLHATGLQALIVQLEDWRSTNLSSKITVY